jgi:hypothetical protein
MTLASRAHCLPIPTSVSLKLHIASVSHERPSRPFGDVWADTGTSTGRLMLAVLGGLADVERDLIRTRTAEGRSRAKAARQAHGPP